MSDERLEVVLRFVAADLAASLDQATDDLQQAKDNAADLDALEQRTERLRRAVHEMVAERDDQPVKPRLPAAQPDRASGTVLPLVLDWSRLVAQAKKGLADRGIDPDTVDIDDLLTKPEIERIERRFTGGFDVRTSLDRYDVAAAVLAGVVGGLVDLLVVRVPGTVLWNDVWCDGGALTSALRGMALPHDNWLASIAHVPFDRAVPGVAGRIHRGRTFGHDPLLGLVLGTVDIMRGSLTGVGLGGAVVVAATSELRVGNPAVALGVEVMHLLSDVVTHMGLPLPGWTALLTVNIGGYGPHLQTIGELAAWMYGRGYDTWHFLTMSTSVASVEATARAYFALRQRYDGEYRADVEAEGARAVAERVSDHPRYQAISLLAHGIATAGNLGKLAIAGGNPLTLNYPQWLMLAKRLLGTLVRPRTAGAVQAQAEHNRVVLDAGWSKVDMVMSRLKEA